MCSSDLAMVSNNPPSLRFRIVRHHCLPARLVFERFPILRHDMARITLTDMKAKKHVCSPQCLSAARDACRRTYLRGLQRGSWSTMVIARRALEFLSSPVEHTGRIAPVPQSVDAGSDLRSILFRNDGVDLISP